MRTLTILTTAALALALGACTHRDYNRESEQERQTKADDAARKAGRTAYNVAQKVEKAARKAGEELKRAGHDLHEGWKEAQRDAKQNGRP